MNQKCQYDLLIEKMGFDENTLFEFSFCHLDYLLSELQKHYDINQSFNIDSFLLRCIYRMLNIWESIHNIRWSNNDSSTLLVLSRTIADNLATINLIFNHTVKEEQELRYLLYVLDGLIIRKELLESRSSVFDSRYITEDDFKNIDNQCNDTLDSDKKSISYIESEIKVLSIYDKINPNIITSRNWKYKSINSNNRYSWQDMCELYDNKSAAENYQKYLSSHTHGLGISDIQSTTINNMNCEYVISLGISMINKTIGIINHHFETTLKDYSIDFKYTDMFNLYIKLLPEEAIKSYVSKIEDRQ